PRSAPATCPWRPAPTNTTAYDDCTGARGSLHHDRHTMPRVVHVPLEIPHRGRISRLAGTARILRTNDDLLPARAKAQGCLPKSPRPGVRIAHQPRGLP